MVKLIWKYDTWLLQTAVLMTSQLTYHKLTSLWFCPNLYTPKSVALNWSSEVQFLPGMFGFLAYDRGRVVRHSGGRGQKCC